MAGLSDSVGSQDTGHESLLGDRQSVQAEGVLAVLVDHLLLQFVGESYDLDGIELALVDADTATLAEGLGDDGLSPLTERDAFHPCPVEGAEPLALVIAFLVLASVYQNGRDPHGPTDNLLYYIGNAGDGDSRLPLFPVDVPV